MSWFILLWDKIPQPPEKIGYVIGNELIPYDDNWNIRRIPIKCESCEDNNYYELYLTYNKFKFMFLPAEKCDQTYFITCPKCSNYKLYLENQEYEELEKNNLIHDHLTFIP
jgi:hypothetical protein